MMMNRYSAISYGLLLVALAGCNKSESAEKTTVNSYGDKTTAIDTVARTDIKKMPLMNKDSAELAELLRDMYKWHAAEKFYVAFDLDSDPAADSMFIGVDWNSYHRKIRQYKLKDFFANEFYAKHLKIAMSIDSSIKKADAKWRNANDGIPLWSTNADDWCNCQDRPDGDWWDSIAVRNLKIAGDSARFNWQWGQEVGIDPPFSYQMKAKRSSGKWRISYMEGFDSYGSVADYDKMMND